MNPTPDMSAKMEHLEKLLEATERARQQFAAAPTTTNAATLYGMKRQLEAFRRTLPKPRLAA
jgi:hypothetical protein